MFLPLSSSWWQLYAYFPELPQKEDEHDRPKEPIFESVAYYYLALRGHTVQHLVNALHWPENEVKTLLATLDQPEHTAECISFCQYLRIPPRLRDMALHKAGYRLNANVPTLDHEQAEDLAKRWEQLSLDEEAQLRAFFQAHGSIYHANAEVLSFDTMRPFEIALETLNPLLSADWRTFEQRQQDQKQPVAPLDIRLGLHVLDTWLWHLEYELKHALWERKDQLLYLTYRFYETATKTWSTKATLEKPRLDTPLVLQYKTKAVQAARQLGNVALLSKVLLDRAEIYYMQRRYSQALQDIQEAVRCMAIERRTLHHISPDFVNGDIRVIRTLAQGSDGALREQLSQLYEKAVAVRKKPQQESWLFAYDQDLDHDDLQQEQGFDFEDWPVSQENLVLSTPVEPVLFPLNEGSNERVQRLVNAYRPGASQKHDAYDAVRHVLGQDQYEVASDLLIAGLHHPDHGIRSNAALMLGELKATEAIAILIDALGDSHAQVRWSAAIALGDLKDVQAVEALITLLIGQETQKRLEAALFWETAPEQQWLQSKDRRWPDESKVVWSAARALGQIGDVRAVEPLVTVLLDETLRNYQQAYNNQDWSHRDPALALWNGHAEALRCRTAEALGHLGDLRAISALGQVLYEEEEMARHAFQALETLHSVQALPILLEASKQPSFYIIEKISSSIEKILDQQDERERGIALLLDALAAQSWCIRAAAAFTLGRLQECTAVVPLLLLLDDDQSDVRTRAIVALANIRDQQAVEPFLAHLATKNIDERRVLVGALGQLGDSRAVDSLLTFLTDADDEMKQTAVLALGALGDTRAVEPLNAMLLHVQNKDLEPSIYTALAQLHDPTLYQRLSAMLKKPSAEQLSWLIPVLGELGDTRVTKALVKLALQEKQRSIAYLVPRALQRIGGTAAAEALVQLIKCALDSNLSFRSYKDRIRLVAQCINVLRTLKDPLAIELLLSLTTRSYSYLEKREIREAAVEALAQFTDLRILEPFIAMLQGEIQSRSGDYLELINWKLLASVIPTLGNLGNPEALPALYLVARFLGKGIYDLPYEARCALILYTIEQKTLTAFAQILQQPVTVEDIQQRDLVSVL